MLSNACPMCHSANTITVATTYRYAPQRWALRGGALREEALNATDTFYCPACGHEWDKERNALAGSSHHHAT